MKLDKDRRTANSRVRAVWMLDLFLGGVAWFLTLVDHAPIDDGGRFSDLGESATRPCASPEMAPGERLPAVTQILHRDEASRPNASVDL